MPSEVGQLHPVDAVPAPGRLAALSLQHVLTMYAGAVTVPLLIASSLQLDQQDTAYLVSADLFACGLVTLIQSFGLGPFGARVPVIMGVTFVSVMPAIAIALQSGLGLPAVFGSSIAAGLIVTPLAGMVGRLRSMLTPAVTGTAMLLIGLSLMGVAVDWAAGGTGSRDYGALHNLMLAGFTVATILACSRFLPGFGGNCAVLIGMISGYVLAWVLGMVDMSAMASEPVVRLVMPFHFGLPVFDLIAVISMVVVLLVTLVESSGMLTMLGEIVDRPMDNKRLGSGLRADCLGAVIGGLFNSFPYTSYAQNIALVSLTGVRSRFVCVGAAAILIGLAMLPKLSALVAAIPPSVLGGAALILFGMVATSGIRSLATAGLENSREQMLIVATSLSVGLIPNVSERFFAHAPQALAPFTHSGVLLGIITAIVLGIFFRAKPGASVVSPSRTEVESILA